MVDRLTPEQRRFNMSRIRGRDTRPEMVIRRLLHRLGYRFRLQRTDLPGRPDIVLPKWRTAIFVHGCFWHGHECGLFRWPATRSDFWRAKIVRTVERDHVAEDTLGRIGWRVLTVWECALRGPRQFASEALTIAIEQSIRSTELTVHIAPQDGFETPRNPQEQITTMMNEERTHENHG